MLPDSRAFTRTFDRLHETGAVPGTNMHSQRAGVQTLNEVEQILQSVERSPSTSTRRLSARLGVPHVRVWRTLRTHGLYPFHVQPVQRLVPLILFTDEATFTRNGINNSRNDHRWSEDNPHASVETNFQLKFSVNVWCGMIDNKLIGPFVLPERLTAARYLEFLRNELPILLEDIPLATRANMFLQHDGAPAHYGREVTQYLNQTFAERWIGRGAPISWPARSPDLNPLDYGMWGWLKSDVYQVKVNTRDELIARITASTARIKAHQDELRSTVRDIIKRSAKCIELGGGIFEPFL